MKNTLENKAKFFAQNIGEYIWDSMDGNLCESEICFIVSKVDVDGNVWVRHERDDIDHKINIKRLSIVKKSLLNISDEDVIIYCGNIPENWEVYKIYHANNIKKEGYCGIKIRKKYDNDEIHFNEDGYKYDMLFPKLDINSIDYLRTKGYALLWNEITVEEQIEFEWVKLKQ